MDITRIPPRSSDGSVHVVVEIPTGSRNKYEYDKELGVIKLDRPLYSAVHYPTEYGFVPCTRGTDGELLDAMVMVDQITFPGCVIEVRLIGVLTITHTDGRPEQKILGVPVSEPRFEELQDVSDVPEHMLKEIEHFFDVFKELQGSDVGVLGWEGAEKARAVLDEGIQEYQKHGGAS
jgi:inorganic pyrophosphatase